MARRDRDAPSGLPSYYLKACALLLLAEEPAHGYELLGRLPAVGPFGVDLGALYRALRGMEDEGLVTSTWEPSAAGPDRRVYRITGRGRQALDAEAGALVEVVHDMATYLRRFTRVARRRTAAA